MEKLQPGFEYKVDSCLFESIGKARIMDIMDTVAKKINEDALNNGIIDKSISWTVKPFHTFNTKNKSATKVVHITKITG